MTTEDDKEKSTFLGDEKKDEAVKESWFQRLKNGITLEPFWLGISMSMMVGMIAYKNFYIQRACMVDLGYSEAICNGTDVSVNKTQIEIESQKIVASVKVGVTLVGGIVTMIAILFLAPWSDASGKRRPLILYPVLGIAIGSLNMLIMQAFPQLPVAWVIYLHYLPIAITGQYSLMGLASASYLGDICVKTGRCVTTVMGSNNGFSFAAIFIGTFMGPIVYRNLGYTAVFLMCFCLEISSFIYGFFMIKDVIEPEAVIPKVYDFRLPLKAFKCVLKAREGLKRRSIILIILITCFHYMCMANEHGILYMYLRNRLQWTEVEYSFLLTIKSSLYIIGTFLIVTLLKKKFKLRDKYIGIIGCMSYLTYYIAFMLCTTGLEIYLIALLGLFGHAVVIAERPILLKQIKANEQGKVACVTSVLDQLVIVLVMPLSNFVYMSTLDWFPAMFLTLSVAAVICQIVCFIFVSDPKDVDKKETEMETLS